MTLEAQKRVGFNCIYWKVVPFINCSWEKAVFVYELVLTDGLMML